MAQQRSVKLSRIVDEFSLEILHKGSDYDSALLTIVDVNRPGLQYAGFFEYFDPRRPVSYTHLTPWCPGGIKIPGNGETLPGQSTKGTYRSN